MTSDLLAYFMKNHLAVSLQGACHVGCEIINIWSVLGMIVLLEDCWLEIFFSLYLLRAFEWNSITRNPSNVMRMLGK